MPHFMRPGFLLTAVLSLLPSSSCRLAPLGLCQPRFLGRLQASGAIFCRQVDMGASRNEMVEPNCRRKSADVALGRCTTAANCPPSRRHPAVQRSASLPQLAIRHAIGSTLPTLYYTEALTPSTPHNQGCASAHCPNPSRPRLPLSPTAGRNMPQCVQILDPSCQQYPGQQHPRRRHLLRPLQGLCSLRRLRAIHPEPCMPAGP